MKDNDTWLTPPQLIKALGKFDLDPCCPVKMPWKTARRMLTVNGLSEPCRGRVWCNPPYSSASAWVDKFLEHNNGIILLSANSPGSPWVQRVLAECDAVMFLKMKLRFHKLSGEQAGAYIYNLLGACGRHNVKSLVMLRDQHGYDGVILKRLT